METIRIRKNAAIPEGHCTQCATCPLLTVDSRDYDMIWETCALGYEIIPDMRQYILQRDKDRFYVENVSTVRRGYAGSVKCRLNGIDRDDEYGRRRFYEPDRVLLTKGESP